MRAEQAVALLQVAPQVDEAQVLNVVVAASRCRQDVVDAWPRRTASRHAHALMAQIAGVAVSIDDLEEVISELPLLMMPGATRRIRTVDAGSSQDLAVGVSLRFRKWGFAEQAFRRFVRHALNIHQPMTKCAPYISSGRYQAADAWMQQAGVNFGFELHDKLIHVGNGGPQPKGRKVAHARNNYSVLLIFRKPRTRKKTK